MAIQNMSQADLLRSGGNTSFAAYARQDLERQVDKVLNEHPVFSQCSDVINVMCDYLPAEEVVVAALVCQKWKEALEERKAKLREWVQNHGFGAFKWGCYFGNVERVPLPLKLWDTLNEKDPYNPAKKIMDTFILFLVPKTVNDKLLSLDRLRYLKRCNGFSIEHGEAGIEEQSVDVSHWVLMRKKIIPGSRGRSLEERRAWTFPNYRVPKIREVVVGVLTHYVATGEKLLSEDPLIYTACQERKGDGVIIVGGFVKSLLRVRSRERGFGDVGTLVLRDVPDPETQQNPVRSPRCAIS